MKNVTKVFVFVWAVSLQAALAMMASAEEGGIPPEDVLAVYRENVSQMRTLRVTSRFASQFTENSRWSMIATAQTVRQAAKRDGLVPQEKARLENLASGYEKQAADVVFNEVHQSRIDYWTDGDNFQIREPAHRHKAEGTKNVRSSEYDEIEFPDGEVSPEGLLSDFSRFFVLGGGMESKGVLRQWDGVDENTGRGYGIVGTEITASQTNVFPPCSKARPEWLGREGKLHRIDEFFSGSPSEYVTLGDVRIGERTYLLLERTREQQGVKGRIRGFLDLEKGALPVRLEYFQAYWFDSLRTFREPANNKTPPNADVIVRDISISEVAPGVYYPISGHVDMYGGRANSDPQKLEAAINETAEWTTVRIEVNREMTANNFAMRFPAETIFVDQPTSQAYIQGDTEQAIRRAIPGTSDLTRPSRHRWWISVGLGVTCLLCLVGFVWRAVRRRR